MIDDYSKSHQILTLYSIFKRKIDDYVDFKQNASTHTILVDGTVKNFLESTLEFLQETDQVHQSFQLSELSNMLARVIGSIKKEDEMFEFCDEIYIQQNLSSALELWKFIARLLQNDQLNFENRFLYFIEDNLRKRIHSLSRLSNYQEKEFNNEILILKNLLNSVPRESISLVSTLSRVVLHEENFTMLSKNCLILKVFQQTFLAGGLGFNIDDLALERDENTGEFKYIWLLCELLTSSYLPSLAGYTHLRNQIQTFCESEVLPLILRECCTEFSESNNTLFFSMILYLTKRSIEKSSLYAKTLGNIIRMIIDPPEGLYELVADFNRWKDLLDVTINTHIDSVLTTEDSNDSQARRKIEMVKIVSNSAKSLLSSLESYQDIRKKIINSLDVDKQSNIILYCAMADDTRWQTAELQFMDQDPEDKTDTYNEVKSLQAILKHVSSQLDQKYSDFATLDSILESLNCAVTKMGIANMFDNFDIDHNKISIFLKNAIDFLIVEESSFENEETEESKEDKTQKTAITLNTLGINLLQFIKMIIGHLHSKDQESTVTIIDGVLEYSKTKAEAFNIKMDLLKDRIKATQTSKSKKKQVQSENKEEQLSEYSRQIQEQEYEVIDCISGVVSNITPYVHTQIDEDVLYTLVGTHIETVQKAAYVTLVHFYQNFIPALKYQYEEEGEINEEEFKEQIEKEIAEGEETKEEEEVKEDTQKVEILKQKRIKGDPDKNVSIMLFDIIEKAPQFKEENHQHDNEQIEESEDEILDEGYLNIQSASTLLDEKVMSSEVYSYLLAWNAMLSKIGSAKMKLKFDQDHEYLRVINSLQEFLTMNKHVYEMLLIILVAYLPTKIKQHWKPSTIIDNKPEWVDLNDQNGIEEFALYSMYNFMTNFPSLAREYYLD